MRSFNSRKSTSLSRMASNYRHILRGHLPHKVEGKKKLQHGGGGMLILSTQKYSSTIPTSFKACCNTIIIGKLSNKQEYYQLIKDYCETFGGEDVFKAMINYTFKDDYAFLCLYCDGDLDPDTKGPVAYKNMSEKLFPTERFPAKEFQLE